jgi:hypothetical protein
MQELWVVAASRPSCDVFGMQVEGYSDLVVFNGSQEACDRERRRLVREVNKAKKGKTLGDATLALVSYETRPSATQPS